MRKKVSTWINFAGCKSDLSSFQLEWKIDPENAGDRRYPGAKATRVVYLRKSFAKTLSCHLMSTYTPVTGSHVALPQSDLYVELCLYSILALFATLT
jgi:hypothetical protein